MRDLADRVAALREAAETASDGPWESNEYGVVHRPDGQVIAECRDESDAALIALTADPVAALRRCDYAERVLAVHSPVPNGGVHEWCKAHDASTEWPCDDWRDLAHAWGVSPDE